MEKERYHYRINSIEHVNHRVDNPCRITFNRESNDMNAFNNEHATVYGEMYLSNEGTAKLLKGLHTRLNDNSIRDEWRKGDPDDNITGSINGPIYDYEPGFTAEETVENENDGAKPNIRTMEPDLDYIKEQDKQHNITEEKKDYSDYFFGNYTNIVKKNEKLPSELVDKLYNVTDRARHENPFDDLHETKGLIDKYAKDKAKAKKPKRQYRRAKSFKDTEDINISEPLVDANSNNLKLNMVSEDILTDEEKVNNIKLDKSLRKNIPTLQSDMKNNNPFMKALNNEVKTNSEKPNPKSNNIGLSR